MKSLAKLLTALMLSVMVILGAGTLTVKAAGWEAPSWGDLSKGEIIWNFPDNLMDNNAVRFSLYRDGEFYTSYWVPTEYMNYSDGSISLDFGFVIDKSGSYTTKAVGFVLDEKGEDVASGLESPFSQAFDYVLPENCLAVPTNLRWITENESISAAFDPVEGASEYYVTVYRGSEYVTQVVIPDSKTKFDAEINGVPGEYTFTVKAVPSNILAYAPSRETGHSPVYGLVQTDNVDPSTLDCKWYVEDGKSFWYEGGVRQGTYDDPNGVVGFGTVRGREIYDPESNAWYWLDAVYDGAKAIGKEVWMPYIYQNEAEWDDATKRNIASESDPGMEDLVYEYMVNGTGKWVRYDEEGRMLKGWVEIKGTLAEKYPDQENNIYYYDNRTGLMAKGFITMDGKVYHFDEITGVLDQIDGKSL